MFSKGWGFVLLIMFYCSVGFAELPTVVIVHGFMGASSHHKSWKSGITSELEKKGFPVYLAETERVSTISEHAQHLKLLIEENVAPGKPIILLGHSQGGLVSRLYAHNNAKEENQRDIISVTTVGTPHRGVPGNEDFHIPGLEFFAASSEMSETNMTDFNDYVTDVPGIHYASVATTTDFLRPWLPGLRFMYLQLNRRAGANDGVVPLASAKWGEAILNQFGKHFKADHLSQMFNLPHGAHFPAFAIGKAIAQRLFEVSTHWAGCDPLLQPAS